MVTITSGTFSAKWTPTVLSCIARFASHGVHSPLVSLSAFGSADHGSSAPSSPTVRVGNCQSFVVRSCVLDSIQQQLLGNLYGVQIVDPPNNPQSFADALDCFDHAGWKEAILIALRMLGARGRVNPITPAPISPNGDNYKWHFQRKIYLYCIARLRHTVCSLPREPLCFW